MADVNGFNGMASGEDVAAPERALYFTEITKDAPAAVIAQLVGADVVHAFGTESIDKLARYRLGDEGMNRRCLALVDEDRKIYSAIYVHKTFEPVSSERDLCGNARDIVHSEAVATGRLAQEASSFIFYSICNLSDVRGVGARLIGHVHEYLTTEYPNSVLSTLSPLRQPDKASVPGIDDYIRQHVPDFSGMAEAEKRGAALGFLRGHKEGVKNFHMGNGAALGYIRLDADTRGEHRLMVNYIYPTDKAVLRANAQTFRSGGIDSLISRTLREDIAGHGVAAGVAAAPAVLQL